MSGCPFKLALYFTYIVPGAYLLNFAGGGAGKEKFILFNELKWKFKWAAQRLKLPPAAAETNFEQHLNLKPKFKLHPPLLFSPWVGHFSTPRHCKTGPLTFRARDRVGGGGLGGKRHQYLNRSERHFYMTKLLQSLNNFWQRFNDFLDDFWKC